MHSGFTAALHLRAHYGRRPRIGIAFLLLLLITGGALLGATASFTAPSREPRASAAEARRRDSAPMTIPPGALAAAVTGRGLKRRRRHPRGHDGRSRELVEAAFEGLVIHAHDRIRNVNPSFAALVGHPIGALIGAPLSLVLPAGRSAQQLIEATLGQAAPVELALRRADGGTILVEGLARRRGDGAVLAVRDVTGRNEAVARIRHLAMHDPLTELANRRLFEDRLAASLSDLRQGGPAVALHYIDLDHFKEMNDEFGHDVGDALLREVAGRLRATCRDTDLVARLGGDEFAILQVGLADPDAPAALASRLLAALAEPFLVRGHALVPGGSIGIAVAPTDAGDPEALVRAADQALYRAKVAGRGTFRPFRGVPGEEARRRRAFGRELGEGLTPDQLRLDFQAIVACADGRRLGFQAVPRLTGPGAAATEELPARWGSIDELGRAVLERACGAAARWPEPLFVAVGLPPNLSRFGDWPHEVEAALTMTGLRPDRLVLEVTEPVLLDDELEVLRVLRALRALGVTIVIDDFGSGYSSLSYLQRFAFDGLKIDRDFIAGLPGGVAARAIVRAILSLAKALNIEVAASHVATAAQLRWLREAGCDRAQGPFVALPAPPAFDGLAEPKPPALLTASPSA